MNGFEAIEFMGDGGKVCLSSKKDLIFGISNGFICVVDERGCFIEEALFNLRLDYEEYIEPKATGWERVGDFEPYTTIEFCGINTSTDNSDEIDEERYSVANYFSTKEKAEEINFKQTLFRKLQRFSDENGGMDIDWNDDKKNKWCLYYDSNSRNLCIYDFSYHCYFGVVYFESKDTAQKAIELFHDDLIKYFTM